MLRFGTRGIQNINAHTIFVNPTTIFKSHIFLLTFFCTRRHPKNFVLLSQQTKKNMSRDAAAEVVKKDHVAAGRRYPRPTETCDNCGGKLILCWGEYHKIPYWRHRGGDGSRISKTPCHYVAETVMHRLAKVRKSCKFCKIFAKFFLARFSQNFASFAKFP